MKTRRYFVWRAVFWFVSFFAMLAWMGWSIDQFPGVNGSEEYSLPWVTAMGLGGTIASVFGAIVSAIMFSEAATQAYKNG